MSWTREDFPDAMKKLNKATRDKAIDIANAMVQEGYEDSAAIPIAISQAKDWYEDASQKEKEEIKSKDLKDHEPSQRPSGARLQDSDVLVEWNEGKANWQVISEGAKQVDSYHTYKKDAVARAEGIAKNRGTQVIKKTKDQSQA